jgi:hypothetical protein
VVLPISELSFWAGSVRDSAGPCLRMGDSVFVELNVTQPSDSEGYVTYCSLFVLINAKLDTKFALFDGRKNMVEST